MDIREITEQHRYPAWLIRYPRLIYVHYFTLQVLFLRTRVCHRAIRNILGDLNKKNLKILDAGCGEGQYIIPLAAKYPDLEFTGIDINPSHIRFLNRLIDKNKEDKNCIFEVTDIETHLSTPQDYDLIFIIGVLQYTLDPGKTLELLAHSQTRGNHLLIYTPIHTNLHFGFYQWIRNKYTHYDEAQLSYQAIRERQLEKWISDVDYKIIHKEYHYSTLGTLGHELMQSLIILTTHWWLLFKIIPFLFFIILMPIFVSLQVVDTWFPSHSLKQGNGLLLILEK